nr:hypothetical protein MtrDRAFT_AC150891g47v2 [Medicago truncatula]
MLQEFLRRLSHHWYAMVMCLVLVMVLVAISHRLGLEDIQKSNSNCHDRTIRRLRVFHGPPLHLRISTTSSTTS